MERFRLGGRFVLSLVLVLATSQTGRSDEANANKPVARPSAPPQNPRGRASEADSNQSLARQPASPQNPSTRSDEAGLKPALARPPVPPQNPTSSAYSGLVQAVGGVGAGFIGFDRAASKAPERGQWEALYEPVQSKGTKSEMTCKVYSLSDLGDDPNLRKWVADTIPEVIMPGTWSQSGGKHVLRYHAPAGVLAIYHTPAAHAQVDAFLKNVKKSIQQKQAAMPNYMTKAPNYMPRNSVLVPAKYSPADPVKEATPSKSTAYPVPAQAQQPKHLFHFIIRYEGEGIIDSTVAGVLKQLYGTEESEDDQPAKKKKKKSKQATQEQTGTPALDQLFHLIVRYEGEGIIDSTVADVLKAMYAGKNDGPDTGNSPPSPPPTGTTPGNSTFPSVPLSVPVPGTGSPQTIQPSNIQAAPAPQTPKPAESSGSNK